MPRGNPRASEEGNRPVDGDQRGDEAPVPDGAGVQIPPDVFDMAALARLLERMDAQDSAVAALNVAAALNAGTYPNAASSDPPRLPVAVPPAVEVVPDAIDAPLDAPRHDAQPAVVDAPTPPQPPAVAPPAGREVYASYVDDTIFVGPPPSFALVGDRLPFPNASDARTAVTVLVSPHSRQADIVQLGVLLGIEAGMLPDGGNYPVMSPADWDPSHYRARFYHDQYSHAFTAKAATAGRNGGSSPIWQRDGKFYQLLLHIAMCLHRQIVITRFATAQAFVTDGVHLQTAWLLLLEGSLAPMVDLWTVVVDQLDCLRLRVDADVSIAADVEQFVDAHPHDHYGVRAREILAQQRRDDAAALARERAKANAIAAHRRHVGDRGGGRGGGGGGGGHAPGGGRASGRGNGGGRGGGRGAAAPGSGGPGARQ